MLKLKRLALLASLLLVFFIVAGSAGAAMVAAASPEEDLARANGEIKKALTAAQAGDLATSEKAYKTYDDTWFEIEEGIRLKSKTAYRTIEEKMLDVSDAFAKTPPDAKVIVATLTALDTEHQLFIKGGVASATTAVSATTAAAETTAASSGASAPATVITPAALPTPIATSTNATSSDTPTIATLLEQLTVAQTLLASGDYAAAASKVKQFQDSWLDVEGQVKTRSADDYRQTENDMARAYNLLTQKSPDAKAVLDRMYTRLEPYKAANKYGIFDATIILLREGLEALLVVVALLTFLKKSGNNGKQPWIWGGAIIGLAVSVALGLAIQLLFSSAIKASNRELIEGVTGLFAAVMLIYVSYWMHGKASAASWNRYIKQKSTAALAKGSLFGLALLSFLAIFREGAETVLFLLGMGSGISLSDLFIGLAIGAVILAVIGVLMVVVGLRIPIGPFFAVASVLVFFLCFKFVGTGIHALQVADLIPSSTASYLPENGFLGMFPTWETTIPQLLLLAAGIAVVVYGRVRDRREVAERQSPNKPAQVAK